MRHEKLYKERLANCDDPRYTFTHYSGRIYPSYNMDSNDIRELRKEYKTDLATNRNSYRISNRAIVIANNHGSVLKSYYTIVCGIINGTFYKFWDGYSATTIKHINEYRHSNGLPVLSKYDWVMMYSTDRVVDNETGEIIYEV